MRYEIFQTCVHGSTYWCSSVTIEEMYGSCVCVCVCGSCVCVCSIGFLVVWMIKRSMGLVCVCVRAFVRLDFLWYEWTIRRTWCVPRTTFISFRYTFLRMPRIPKWTTAAFIIIKFGPVMIIIRYTLRTPSNANWDANTSSNSCHRDCGSST